MQKRSFPPQWRFSARNTVYSDYGTDNGTTNGVRQENTRDKTALAALKRACYASRKVTNNEEENGSGAKCNAVILSNIY
jgi:hypothetical protein